MIAGVCAGIGHYVALDPVVIRIAFAILTLASGAGILLYLLLAILMPEAEAIDHPGLPPAPRSASVRRIMGLMLLIAGAALLAGRFVPGMEQIVWPVTLLAIGAAILAQGPAEG